jgi:hypothetical protein
MNGFWGSISALLRLEQMQQRSDVDSVDNKSVQFAVPESHASEGGVLQKRAVQLASDERTPLEIGSIEEAVEEVSSCQEAVLRTE